MAPYEEEDYYPYTINHYRDGEWYKTESTDRYTGMLGEIVVGESLLSITGYHFDHYVIDNGDEEHDLSGTKYIAIAGGVLDIYYTANYSNITYLANGGTVGNGYKLSSIGEILIDDWQGYPYMYDVSYGASDKPESPELFDLRRPGYTFIGWKVKGSNEPLLDPNKYYDSSVYTDEYDSSKSVVNTDVVYCKLEAQWRLNTLTVHYYSNYADYGTWQGQALNVDKDSNVLVVDGTVLYDVQDDLNNVQNPSYLFLSRTGYTPTGYWGTSPNGGNLVHQDTSYPTGQALAEALGKDISTGDASVDVYAQWSRDESIEFNGKIVDRIVFNGQTVEHLIYNGSILF